MQKYKATGYLTLFDEEERQQRLSKIGMVDASFVLAPRQHNTPEENKQIKDEEGDGLWKDNPPQEMPEGHRCPLDTKRRRGLFRLQEPHQECRTGEGGKHNRNVQSCL